MEFRHATSADQALAWLAEDGDAARVLAGGTDVMPQYARGEIKAASFVHIGGLDSLAAIGVARQTRIGALVTHRRLATDRHVRDRHPALAEAAATVGGWQTQTVGTVGGNLCNASPAADTAAPLLVCDAVVELASSRATRAVPLADFFTGRRAVDRHPDELVVAIEAAPLERDCGEVYLKVGRRGAMVVAVVGLALRLRFDSQDRITRARLALCSVAATPVRAYDTERALVEGGGTPEAITDAADLLQHEIDPVDDARGSAAYRRLVLRGLLERAVSACRSRAAGVAAESEVRK